MKSWFASTLAFAALATRAGAWNIVLTNDDGWATAQIRAEYDALRAAGYKVVLSAPAVDRSGTGSSTAPPVVLAQPCEFNTCATGSPAIGTDPDDPNLHYVNSFPSDAVRAGIQDLAPPVFGGPPQFVVSGSNVGNNLGDISGSGTIGAACEATRDGIPAFAFSGATASQISYTTLTTQPNSTSSIAAHIYTDLILKFLSTYLPAEHGHGHGHQHRSEDGHGNNHDDHGHDHDHKNDHDHNHDHDHDHKHDHKPKPLIQPGITINVNFGRTTNCTNGASDFKFIATRLLNSTAGTDTELCGSKNLPPETTVVRAGCFVSVSVFNATDKLDVDGKFQAPIFERLKPILSCFTP